MCAALPVRAQDAEGFTEPNRTIHVGASESGVIAKLAVQEGDAVRRGQVLATLDSEVHEALLAIADQARKSRGRLDSSLAEVRLRQERLVKFESLRSEGHARQEEVDRARTELLVAEGNLTSAREDLLIKELEYRRIKAQLARRTIRSPVDGVVTALHKQLGEFAAPSSPDIVTLVELHPLLARFSMPSNQAASLARGSKVFIEFLLSGEKVEGVVVLVSPVTDAESQTVLVKVRIDNPRGSLRSGERCGLHAKL